MKGRKVSLEPHNLTIRSPIPSRRSCVVVDTANTKFFFLVTATYFQAFLATELIFHFQPCISQVPRSLFSPGLIFTSLFGSINFSEL